MSDKKKEKFTPYVEVDENLPKYGGKIVFRDEQETAIDRAFKHLSKPAKSDTKCQYLWNAKMRFGKTICALELVRRLDAKTTLIVTHRPVVDEGWHEDFEKIFNPARLDSLKSDLLAADKTYKYGSRSLEKEKGLDFPELVDFAKKDGCYGVFFVSMQYLALAEIAGGENTEKQKRDILEFPWDMVIVDEAHEGTQTDRGQNVLSILAKSKSETHKTNMLHLSGTPFNLYDDFGDDELYTWDYVMEQTAKANWDSAKGPNPYLTLPRMNIFTYDLGRLVVGEGASFTFAEFFRTKSGSDLPASEQGKFVHEDWVKKFLDKMCEDSATSNYPFSTDEYRLAFNHTLWVVPGVKEAKALEELLNQHEIFRNFTIVNVAGDSDDEEARANALDGLRKKITRRGRETNTITLSCGRLTTGVTVPEWSAVFYLKGSENTSASTYMQTIFRTQTPYVFEEDGIKKYKANCYVFDFAPDRSLRMLAETAKFSTLTQKQKLNAKNVGSHDEDIQKMKDFLKFCPVISLDGTMKEFDAERLFTQLNQVYIDRVVRNGFNDNSLYDVQALLDLDVDNLNALGDTIAKSSNLDKPPKAKPLPPGVQMASSGLSGKGRKEQPTGDDDTKTDEDDEEKKRKKARRDERDRRIKIIRGLALRVPLMMFGAEVTSDSEEITRDNFTEKIDDKSWEEFMPRGVTKADFNSIKTAFIQTIFTGAGKKIRQLARQADDMTVTERIQRITEIFDSFHNPDKETVLTPWRVVNMHMSDTIGGYCFFNESFTGPNQVPRYMAGDKLIEYVDTNEPRFVERKGVTDKVFFDREEGSFDLKSRILEINSKTGLYPLYVAYTLFRARKADFENLGLIEDTSKYSVEEEHAIWDDILLDNIYVVCNTLMAARITKRTLVGFRDVSDDCVNIKPIKLVEEAMTNRDKLIKDLKRPGFWHKGAKGAEMKFNAIVGNPPYQVMTAKTDLEKNGQARRKSIFQLFQMVADALMPRFVSMIYPGGRWMHRSGKGMEEFGLAQINDVKLSKVIFYPNSEEIFKSVAIADGISIVFKDGKKTTPKFDYVYHEGSRVHVVRLDAPGDKLIALNPRNESIIRKVEKFADKQGLQYVFSRVLSQKLFGIESEFVELNPKKVKPFNEGYVLQDHEIKLLANDRAGKAGRSQWYVAKRSVIEKDKQHYIDQWQVVVSSANAGGQKRDWQLAIIDNLSAFGRSRVALGTFKTKTEAENFYKFCRSALVRFMFLMTDEALTSLGKKVPDLMDYTAKNKLVDFSKNLDVQLKELVGLTDEEFNYIKGAVRPLVD